jgi:hypothetical protein
MFDQGTISVLYQLLESPAIKVKEMAIFCLSNMAADDNIKIRDAILQAGVV